jgi:hypothetical protein
VNDVRSAHADHHWCGRLRGFLPAARGAPFAAGDGVADSAITAGAAVGVGVIAGGSALLGGRAAKDAASRAADDAQLRAVRQQAADDIRTVGESGAELEKAVTEFLESAGVSQEARSKILAKSAELDTRVEFIWDNQFREKMRLFSRLAREAAVTEQAGELRAHAVHASEAWKDAKGRAGIVWRELMRAVVKASEVLPDESPKHDLAA